MSNEYIMLVFIGLILIIIFITLLATVMTVISIYLMNYIENINKDKNEVHEE